MSMVEYCMVKMYFIRTHLSQLVFDYVMHKIVAWMELLGGLPTLKLCFKATICGPITLAKSTITLSDILMLLNA